MHFSINEVRPLSRLSYFISSPHIPFLSLFPTHLPHSSHDLHDSYVQVWVEGVETSELDQVLPTFLHTMNQEVMSKQCTSAAAVVSALDT